MRVSPRLGIALVSTLVVAIVAIVDARRTSPGPLTRVHARIPELEGRSGCSECHGGWRTSMTTACLECHETIRTHIALEVGLHGSLPEAEAERCGRCHADHHGEGFVVVNLQSFRQAGVPDPDRFDHARIGWTMEGKHSEQECSKCHENADVGVLPEGAHRFVGLDQDCSTCHEDSHEGRMQLECAQCHGQSDFKELRSLGHERFLPLIGGHGDVGCRECHAEESDGSLENIGAFGVGDGEGRECRACHDDPHREAFVDGVAARLNLAPGASCVECHAAEHTDFHQGDTGVALHAESGFALDAPHGGLECSQCHKTLEQPFEARFPGRDADACSACHEDVHGGQFEEGPFSHGDCLACHRRTAFEPHAFDLEKHARTGLPLDGAHAGLACEECHEVKKPLRPRTFRGTPKRCDKCHVDAHSGFFAPHAKQLSTAAHGICASCHGTDAFDNELAAFDHELHAGFELDAAHEQASCEDCHPRAARKDELGRAFGHALPSVGGGATVTGCADCHADPHAGDFDEPGLPKAVGGLTGCARCHTTASFRALRDDWDHRRWTGFELDGAHGQAGCSACHAPRRAPDAQGRTWDAARGSRCADCHADPHARQFDQPSIGGATACERCHETSRSWSELDFHHDRDSRFDLGQSHAKVACDSCHRPADAAAPENAAAAPAPLPPGVVRYRPMEMGCVSCHGTLDGPAIKRRGK